jgi:hypothetical protein
MPLKTLKKTYAKPLKGKQGNEKQQVRAIIKSPPQMIVSAAGILLPPIFRCQLQMIDTV